MITSANKKYLPTHHHVLLQKPSTVLCEQIMTVDKTRLLTKVDELSEEDMAGVDAKIKISLGLCS